MARKRMLSPEIWADEAFGNLDALDQLLYIGLISQADDEGRLRAQAPVLRAAIFVWKEDVSNAMVAASLQRLASVGLIWLYEVDGKPYVEHPHWTRYQKINRPTPTILPACPEDQKQTPNVDAEESDRPLDLHRGDSLPADGPSASIIPFAPVGIKTQSIAGDWSPSPFIEQWDNEIGFPKTGFRDYIADETALLSLHNAGVDDDQIRQIINYIATNNKRRFWRTPKALVGEIRSSGQKVYEKILEDIEDQKMEKNNASNKGTPTLRRLDHLRRGNAE